MYCSPARPNAARILGPPTEFLGAIERSSHARKAKQQRRDRHDIAQGQTIDEPGWVICALMRLGSRPSNQRTPSLRADGMRPNGTLDTSMTDLVTTLHKWQTLIGSLLGGMFALATALVVASSAVRAARRTAAALVIVDLLSIKRVAEFLEALAKKDGIKDENYPLWVSEQLIWRRPQLSSSYDSHVANLVGVHEGLSAHLSLLKMVYSSLNDHLVRIESDAEDRRKTGPPRIPRPLQATEADAKFVADWLDIAGAHASCAAHLLGQLVTSRTPTFLTRLRMRVCPSPIEVKSKELLRDGRI